jgi:hypothetical protein
MEVSGQLHVPTVLPPGENCRGINWLEEYNPCGGGVEYLHRDPESRRRRRKGMSQIWDSKIWSRVPRDSTPERLCWQGPAAYINERPLFSSERAPHKKQDRNCQTVINIWSWAPDGARHQDLLTDWPSVAMWLRLWLEPRRWQTSEFSVVDSYGKFVVEEVDLWRLKLRVENFIHV